MYNFMDGVEHRVLLKGGCNQIELSFQELVFPSYIYGWMFAVIIHKQAGAELGQVHLNLGLGFT